MQQPLSSTPTPYPGPLGRDCAAGPVLPTLFPTLALEPSITTVCRERLATWRGWILFVFHSILRTCKPTGKKNRDILILKNPSFQLFWKLGKSGSTEHLFLKGYSSREWRIWVVSFFTAFPWGMFSLVCCIHTPYSHPPQLSFLASTGISINICSPEQSDSQAKSFLYPVFRTILVFCLLCTNLLIVQLRVSTRPV